jgi:hypothetical protein
MELTVNRKIKTGKSTISDFFVNGALECHSLEPTDRGLNSTMNLAQIAAIKVPDHTAVPTGRYQVTKYYSPKHKAIVPCMVGIPGFAYVEIHIGNFSQDTDACLLLGTAIGPDEVLNSKVAIDAFYPKFFAALEACEEVWITYQDEPQQ